MTATNTTSSEVLRSFMQHEHTDLTAGIDRIHETACDIAAIPADRLSPRIANIVVWIEKTLKPHMIWEETWLLPEVDRYADTPWLARLVRFDHRQISRRAEALSADRIRLAHGPEAQATSEARCDLFALEALLRAHLEREERFLLPLLAGD